MPKQNTSYGAKIILVVLTIVLMGLLYWQYVLNPLISRRNDEKRENASAHSRLEVMNSLENGISKTQDEAASELAKSEIYRDEFMVFTATEDIEREFTYNMLNKFLYPLAISITQEQTADENPFEIFNVSFFADGDMEGIKSMCDYINNEKSYRLTDLKLSDERTDIRAEFTVSVVYVKEEGEADAGE